METVLMETVLRIDETEMVSTATRHRARLDPEGWWRVSWLPPTWSLTRDQAITAMTLAEAAAVVAAEAGDREPREHRLWSFIETWAAELGLGGSDALARVEATTP